MTRLRRSKKPPNVVTDDSLRDLEAVISALQERRELLPARESEGAFDETFNDALTNGDKTRLAEHRR